jgi:hypothetical protein
MYYPSPRGMGMSRGVGMGDAQLDQQISSTAVGAATATVGILAALHSVVFGLAITGPIGAAIGGAIAALGMVANLLIKEFSGCGQSCIIASNDANKFETYLQQNLAAYVSSPVRYASMQAAALANFDTIWNALEQACSDPSLGDAGRRCISDRSAGACQWKATPGSWNQVNGVWTWTGAGQAGSGDTCWNWDSGYRAPIANDPGVQPDPVPGDTGPVGASDGTGDGSTDTSSGVSVGGMSIPGPLLLAGAALLAAFALTD